MALTGKPFIIFNSPTPHLSSLPFFFSTARSSSVDLRSVDILTLWPLSLVKLEPRLRLRNFCIESLRSTYGSKQGLAFFFWPLTPDQKSPFSGGRAKNTLYLQLFFLASSDRPTRALGLVSKKAARRRANSPSPPLRQSGRDIWHRIYEFYVNVCSPSFLNSLFSYPSPPYGFDLSLSDRPSHPFPPPPSLSCGSATVLQNLTASVAPDDQKN